VSLCALFKPCYTGEGFMKVTNAFCFLTANDLLKVSISPIPVRNESCKKMGIKSRNKWPGNGKFRKIHNILTAYLQSTLLCYDQKEF